MRTGTVEPQTSKFFWEAAPTWAHIIKFSMSQYQDKSTFKNIFILQVVPDNEDGGPAVTLYSKMDFELQSTLGQWENLVTTVIPSVCFCFQCKCLTFSCDWKGQQKALA